MAQFQISIYSKKNAKDIDIKTKKGKKSLEKTNTKAKQDKKAKKTSANVDYKRYMTNDPAVDAEIKNIFDKYPNKTFIYISHRFHNKDLFNKKRGSCFSVSSG